MNNDTNTIQPVDDDAEVQGFAEFSLGLWTAFQNGINQGIHNEAVLERFDKYTKGYAKGHDDAAR